MDKKLLSHIVEEVAIEYFEAIDGPRALACALMLRHHEYTQLAELRVDPRRYKDANDYFAAAKATEFLRKCEDLPSGIDTEEIAVNTFFECERLCFTSNRRISAWDYGETYNPAMVHFLDLVEKHVRRLMGRIPGDLSLRFGPGVTFGTRQKRSLIPDKIAQVPEMTPAAWVFLRDFARTAWYRNLNGTLFCSDPAMQQTVSKDLQIPCVDGNRFTTVPKDATTDRGIAIEPSLNLCIQLALGGALRRNLNKAGLLLLPEERDILPGLTQKVGIQSEELHKVLAKKASLDGDLATIDLSSASDTICYNLIKRVVPPSWFRLLDAARSPKTRITDKEGHHKWYLLEKFSSMGNGYTFELETALFSAICLATAEIYGVDLCVTKNFSVYGDDIIVPTALAEPLLSVLRALGFIPNRRKTFTEGPFRESCGGDYFLGMDVRPIYLKQAPRSPVEWVALHNGLKAMRAPKRALELCVAQIPKHLRVYGDETLEDQVLHSETRRTVKEKHGMLYTRVLRAHAKPVPLRKWDEKTAIASFLYGVGSEGQIPRDAPQSYRLAWVNTP